MNIQVLQYLIAISEERSLTKAAERFYLSQPSLSHHLANVEKELGVKLFRREGRSLLPTEDGIIFINNARAILHTETQARQRIEKLKDEKQLFLRIGAAQGEIPWLQEAVLPLLAQSQPQLRIRLTACGKEEALTALKEDEQDAAVLMLRRALPPGSRKEFIIREEPICFTVPHGLASQPLPPDLGSLCFFRCQSPEAWDRWGQESLEAAGIRPRLTCIAPGSVTAAELVAAGHGCAFLPKSAWEAYPEALAIHPDVPSWTSTWTFCCRPPRSAEQAEALEAFLQAARQAAASVFSAKQPG